VLKEVHTLGWTVVPVKEHAAGICGEEGEGNLGRWQKWIYSMAKTEGEGIETLQEFEEQLAEFMELGGRRSGREGWDMEWVCWGRDYAREGEEQTVEDEDDDDGHGPEVLEEWEGDNLSPDASRTAMSLDTYGRNHVVAPVLPVPSSSPLSSAPSIDGMDVEDDEMVDLATFPRCLRCVKRRNGCDRRKPICGRCEAAGVGEDGCVFEDVSKAKMRIFGKKTGKMVSQRDGVATATPVKAPTPALDLETSLSGVEMEQTGVALEVEAEEVEKEEEKENKQIKGSNGNANAFRFLAPSPSTPGSEKTKKARHSSFHNSNKSRELRESIRAENQDARIQSLRNELEDMRRALEEKEEQMRNLKEELGLMEDEDEQEVDKG
jgi:hypothetical protein